MITYEKYNKVYENKDVLFNGIPTTVRFVFSYQGLKDHDAQDDTHLYSVTWNTSLDPIIDAPVAKDARNV